MDEKMVDLKLKEKKKTDMDIMAMKPLSSEKYPYGLNLSFESEQIKKLPVLSNSQVGDKVIIHAECCVVRKESHEIRDNETRENVGVQIEKIAVMPKINKKPEEMNSKEYRNMRENE